MTRESPLRAGTLLFSPRRESGKREASTIHALYAGDGPIGGAADYLLGILGALKAKVRHVLPTKPLAPALLSAHYDVIILSDFPRAQASDAAQRAIAERVAHGVGLLMVGGWASFSGPRGGWRGSRLEALLPVSCRLGDDRLQWPGGALLVPVRPHAILRGLSWSAPPAICGLNQVRPKAGGRVLLGARAIRAQRLGSGGYRLSLTSTMHPLLVVDDRPRRRVAALTTDVAPHWCGGLVDWGVRRRRLRVSETVTIDVGERYVHFLTALIRWLAGHA